MAAEEAKRLNFAKLQFIFHNYIIIMIDMAVLRIYVSFINALSLLFLLLLYVCYRYTSRPRAVIVFDAH